MRTQEQELLDYAYANLPNEHCAILQDYVYRKEIV